MATPDAYLTPFTGLRYMGPRKGPGLFLVCQGWPWPMMKGQSRPFMINSGNPGNFVERERESWWWTLGRDCWADPQMIPLLMNLVSWVSPSTPHMKSRCRQKVENIPVFCLFPKTRVSLSGLDMWPLLLTRWRRIRECLERENGVKGHSSLGGETRNRRFVGGAEIFGTLITGTDPRPGSRPVHLPTLGNLHSPFGWFCAGVKRLESG